MDLIHGLTARYCARQDARGFIELWGLLIAVAGAAIAILLSARRRIGDRKYRLVAYMSASILACVIFLTGGFALTIFWSCYESAPASLGMVVPNSFGTNLNTMVCVSLHAVETIDEWILTSVFFVASLGLLVMGILRVRSIVRRALAFAGGAVALLFALANGGLMLFGLAWCQSSRLF